MKHSYSGALENYNFIRAHNWPHDYRIESGILELSHELYRYGLNDIDSDEVGKETSIKLFLSHAKKGDTGLNHAQEIKSFIDNSNMNRFFDANEISPGFKFDEEIESHLKNSTMIAIVSDAYSSRYWCQREVLTAKSEYRPIVVVNSLPLCHDSCHP
ncbi:MULTISPECIES: toll/interleukin-1 receptor domain-containing protein [unclassified Psychrobacter]|uniref:toll/interleukin-1 receptor domain-containing protein n=1 Tax=unclassified Psychrobacter TaxID=196806 RepID=UPI00041D5735|nr:MULTISPECIES: toll/interleukin-1 receptor domain-containing protein [unclassified Psychrobacter]